MKIIRQHMVALAAAFAVVSVASSAQAKPRHFKHAKNVQAYHVSAVNPSAWRSAPILRPADRPIARPAFNSSPIYHAQGTISPSKAKSIAAKHVKGAKFVDISRSGGTYRVRMLRKDGRVIDVMIDAATGRVLK